MYVYCLLAKFEGMTNVMVASDGPTPPTRHIDQTQLSVRLPNFDSWADISFFSHKTEHNIRLNLNLKPEPKTQQAFRPS